MSFNCYNIYTVQTVIYSLALLEFIDPPVILSKVNNESRACCVGGLVGSGGFSALRVGEINMWWCGESWGEDEVCPWAMCSLCSLFCYPWGCPWAAAIQNDNVSTDGQSRPPFWLLTTTQDWECYGCLIVSSSRQIMTCSLATNVALQPWTTCHLFSVSRAAQ